MNYLAIHVSCPLEITELILAELSDFPFDSFEEKDGMISAYAPENTVEIKDVKAALSRYEGISIETEILPKENWNEDWEKNYEPVYIDDQVIIRAEFHESEPAYPYEIIITPKMSFGTGHHATTHLMVQQLMKLNVKNKSVADVGSGTGVLAIMASKLGASSLLATDIDDWCIDNCRENFELNNIPGVDVRQGPIKSLNLSTQFDILLANINKNILLDEIEEYEKLLKTGGSLLLSGFYEPDIIDLEKKAESLNFLTKNRAIKNDWAVLLLEKVR